MTDQEHIAPKEHPSFFAEVPFFLTAVFLTFPLGIALFVFKGTVQERELDPIYFHVAVAVAIGVWVCLTALHFRANRRADAYYSAEEAKRKAELECERQAKERLAKMTKKERADELLSKFNAEIQDILESPLGDEDKKRLVETLEQRRDQAIKEIYENGLGPSLSERFRNFTGNTTKFSDLTPEERQQDVAQLFENLADTFTAARRLRALARSGDADAARAEVESMRLKWEKSRLEREKLTARQEKGSALPPPKTFDAEAAELRAERDKRVSRISSDDPEATQDRLRRDIEEWFEVEFNKLQKKYRE